MTVGGDKLSYDEDTGSPTASILETKLLANGVISDHKKYNSKFCAIDLKDFFLNTPMDKPEYIRIHKKYFSPNFVSTYKLHDKIAPDNHIYCGVKKGMYGLKQAAILAYKLLVKRLAIDGYYPIPLTNGLFAHRQLPTKFALTSFNERIEPFKRLYISDPSAIDNQRNYLQRVRKNDRYTVLQFFDRLKHINMLLRQFPSASDSDCFNATELKRIFYNSMPIRWRTNFINSGQSLHSSSIESLRTYMVQQENQTDAHRHKARDGNKKIQNKQPFKFNRGKKPSSKFNNNHKGQSKDIKKKKLANEDDCPIHGASHKWGHCHQNQYRENCCHVETQDLIKSQYLQSEL